MDVSVIIINYNVYSDIITCIDSIKKYTDTSLEYEIFVIDNDSSNRDIESVKKDFPEVKFFQNSRNEGFGAATNIGLKNASGKYILLVNPDIIFFDDAIGSLFTFMENLDEAGAAGPVFIRPAGNTEYYYSFFPSFYSRLIQQSGFYFKTKKMKKRIYKFFDENINKKKPFRVDWILGACLIFRKEIYDKIGGFDESYFLFEEEVDYQKRMNKLGYYSYMLPETKVIHNHHSSTSKTGLGFIRFIGFRSMMIFTSKHTHGFLRIGYGFVHSVSVIHRLLRGIFLKKYRVGNVSTHIKLFSGLFSLIFLSKDNKNILKFNFDEHLKNQLLKK